MACEQVGVGTNVADRDTMECGRQGDRSAFRNIKIQIFLYIYGRWTRDGRVVAR